MVAYLQDNPLSKAEQREGGSGSRTSRGLLSGTLRVACVFAADKVALKTRAGCPCGGPRYRGCQGDRGRSVLGTGVALAASGTLHLLGREPGG